MKNVPIANVREGQARFAASPMRRNASRDGRRLEKRIVAAAYAGAVPAHFGHVQNK